MTEPQTVFTRHPKTSLAVVLLVLLLIICCCFEWLLRTYYEKRWVYLGRPWTERSVRLREMPPLFRDRPESGVDFEVDGRGFVKTSFVHDQPDLTILFLGGSTTACRAVHPEKRFPFLVGRMLEKGFDRKIDSVNGGVVGNNSMHSNIALFAKGLPIKPDIAVMMHNINDLVVLLYEKTYWNNNSTRSIIVAEPQSTTAKFRLMLLMIKDMTFPYLYAQLKKMIDLALIFKPKRELDEFYHLRGKKIQYSVDGMMHEFEKSLKMFVAICRANDIVPVLMTQASRLKAKPDEDVAAIVSRRAVADFGISYDAFRGMHMAFNAAIAQVAREQDVLLVDIAGALPQDQTVIYDLVHLSDTGSERVAQIVSDGLSPLVSSCVE